LEPAPIKASAKHQRRQPRRDLAGADGVEVITAIGTRQQTKGQQQRQGAEAGHDQVEIAGAGIGRVLMMGHDQRPRTQRHEFPGEQEREGVIGQQHQVHPGQKRRVERQHPLRGCFVLAVAKGEQAGDRAAEVDHDQEKRRQRVQPEMRAEPGQANGQSQGFRRLPTRQIRERSDQGHGTDRQRNAVHLPAAVGGTGRDDCIDAHSQQDHR
jgi:hypothetical protein